MAKRLTEEMVIARSKISDLSKVKRLNCWGSELQDVSLLQVMPNVEVLSLSINKINTLADFQYCNGLQELYIRQNDIRDLNQICYLQNLPNLKNLWLGENPCANVEGYRLSVLKALPQLQKLDNVAVTQEELKEAVRKGKTLVHPEDVPDTEEEEYVPTQQYQKYQEYPNEAMYSPQTSPTHQEPEYIYDGDEDFYTKEAINENNRGYSPSSFTERSPPRSDDPARHSYSPEQEYVDRKTNNDQECLRNVHYYNQKSPTTSNNDDSSEGNYKNFKISKSQSSQSMREYSNGDRHHPQQHHHNDINDTLNQGHEVAPRRERYVCSASHQPPFNRRPVARNSNILSAVLCLVKELDYPSLEVVEMTIRCRMNELEE